MGFLNQKAQNILANLAEGFLPRLSDQPDTFLYLSASDINLAYEVEKYLENLRISKKEKRYFTYLLLLVNSRLFCGLIAGVWKPFVNTTPEEKEHILQAWEANSQKPVKQLFSLIKGLILSVFYAAAPKGKPNPTWPFLSFGVYKVPGLSVPKTIVPLAIKGKTHLSCQVLVIGSGAGGGVVAGELAKAGLDVIVVEKGSYFNETDFNSIDLLDLYTKTLERGGLFASSDGNLILGAGNALGGGTIINYAGSVPTPDYVLQEWASDYHFNEAISKEYQLYYEAINKRLHVNVDESFLDNQSCALLEQGCKKLNYAVYPYPRNVKGCVDCSFCHLGCRYGAKQSMLKTYLQDAADHGARFLVNSYCQRIEHAYGQVKGAFIVSEDEQKRKHSVYINAQAIVVAGGALHTPALLLRSGLKNVNIGKNFKVHPGYQVIASFPDQIQSWHGAPMTRVCKEFMNLDGSGYGSIILTFHSEPRLVSLVMPWISAKAHRDMMMQFPYYAGFGVLARDYYGGEIKINKNGDPICYYQLHPYDEKHLQTGINEAVRIAVAAGAKEVIAQHAPFLKFQTQKDNLEDYLGSIAKIPISQAGAVGSVHLMSSCRIAGNSYLGAIQTNGETYEIKNLFVADGSALPTATGVNPMLSICSLASHVAQGLKSKFSQP